MAGIVPVSSRSGRKQWTLHDGARSPLGQLRSQLAEDGCPESQVVLAKQLLEEKCEENAKLGVYWLTKASEQGNLEATNILRECLATGRGITEHNYYDVKNCLDMSQAEKLARRAARRIFTSLSNGEDFITTEQLRQCMRELASPVTNRTRIPRSFSFSQDDSRKEQDTLCNDSGSGNRFAGDSLPLRSENRFEEAASNDFCQGEKISEAALVSAATSYARGMLPTVSSAVCAVETSQMTDYVIPWLQRSFIHPVASIKILYFWLMKTLGKGVLIKRILLPSNMHTLLLLLLYSLVGTESLVLFIPVALYYLSFVIMVIATFQMLQWRRDLNDFRAWSGLFLSYSGGSLNPEEAEYQFCRNNLKPYGHFFLALLLNLIIYPIIAHQWTPQSEFTIIAVLLTLITLVNFTWKDSSKYPDFLALFSFGIDVLAKYPYEMDIVVAQGWRFLDIRVPTFPSYVVGNGIEFCLNCRVFFYLMLPSIFLKMAARNDWRGTYQTLIPHCVTLSWWHIAILSSQGATWYGLIRGALALVGMVLFLPIAGIASVILPIVAATKYLSESDLAMRIFITTVIGGVPFIALWYFRKFGIRRFNWIITFTQIVLGIGAAVFLSWPMIKDSVGNSDTNSYEATPMLSWEQYQNYCHQPAWEGLSSKAQIHIQCAQLEGVPVSWEGYVTNVRLRSIRNTIATILNNFPDSVRDTVSCMYGNSYQSNCHSYVGPYPESCKIFQSIQRRGKCNLSSWNRYEFEISVKMTSGMWGNTAEVFLIADHSFTNFSLNIYPGDKIWFSGTLINADFEKDSMLGGTKPHIDLEEARCVACYSLDLKSCKRHKRRITLTSILSDIWHGTKTVLNFLLNPVVFFK